MVYAVVAMKMLWLCLHIRPLPWMIRTNLSYNNSRENQKSCKFWTVTSWSWNLISQLHFLMSPQSVGFVPPPPLRETGKLVVTSNSWLLSFSKGQLVPHKVQLLWLAEFRVHPIGGTSPPERDSSKILSGWFEVILCTHHICKPLFAVLQYMIVKFSSWSTKV